MAAAALLRSLANKMARAPPTHHLARARGLHGGAAAPSGPAAAASLPPPPTSCNNQADQFVVGMASASQLGTLATPPHRLVFQRGLSASTPPTSKMDLSTAHAKGRAAAANVMLFACMGYMCSLIPRLDRLASKLEAQKKARLELDDDLTQAIEAVELLLAEEDVSALVPQDAGHGEHPVGATQEGTTRYDDLLADITKHRIALESASSKWKA